MLYAVITLALAVALKTSDGLLEGGVLCDSDFTKCSGGVDPNEAKLHHIAALKEMHGILASGTATCTGTAPLTKGANFHTTVNLPAIGDQSVSLLISSMNGKSGTGSLKAHGVAAFQCADIAFKQAGSKIVLDKPLHEHCPALSQSISLSQLEYCADQQALYAKVGTPLVDLHVAAAMDALDDRWDAAIEKGKAAIEKGKAAAEKGNAAAEKGNAAIDAAKSKCLCQLPAGSAMSFPIPTGLGNQCQTSADCSAGLECDKGSLVTSCPAVSPGGGNASPGASPSASPGASPSASPSAAPSAPKSSGGCFAKDSTTACLFASAADETCSPVLMTDLVPGDLVLGRDGATTVVAVQHKAVDMDAEMLTFHTAEATVSMTPDHGLFVDGALVAASDAKVGSQLSSGVVVKRITKSEAKIINAVTMDGTIVANGVLAASNPMWIAALTVDAPLMRAVVNAALFTAGDVDSVGAGFSIVLGKTMPALLVAVVAVKALQARQASK